MHNSFPSKSIFKSVIHLCYHPDVTTPLNNSDQLTQSVTELLWNMCGNLARVIMKKNDHRIGKYLCYHEIWLHQPFSRTTPVLSLEHLIPMSHTALLQFIHDAPSFPPAALISGGRGACILHSVRVGIWIGLSLLEQSLAAWSRLPPPVLIWLWHQHHVCWKNSGLKYWGCFALWHFLLWWCSDTTLAITAFSVGNWEEEWLTFTAENSVPVLYYIGQSAVCRRISKDPICFGL